MSGFLSSRYLKFLEPPQPDAEGLTRDELLAGDGAERRRFRAGLAVAFVCLAGAAVSRLLIFFAGFKGLPHEFRVGYVALGLVLASLWTGAAWALTPPRLGRDHPRLRTVQRLVRVSQLLWPVGYACWLVAALRGNEGLHELGRALRLLAGAGALLLAWELWWLAERADREKAARRINAFVWLVAPLTLLVQAFPKLLPWYLLTPLGFILLFWAWVMLLFAAGVLELHRHVRWSMAHLAGQATHNQRVAEIRRSHDRRIESSMRPLPPLPPDMPLAPPQGPGRG